MKSLRFLSALTAVVFLMTLFTLGASASEDQWFFDDAWTYSNGSLTHGPTGGEMYFVPEIDGSKGFKISFDLTIDAEESTSQIPSIQIKLRTLTQPEEYFFSRIKYSPSNYNWLVEPQFYNGNWNNLIQSPSWVEGSADSYTVSVTIERAAGKNELKYSVKVKDDVYGVNGDLYIEQMSNYINSDQLQLMFNTDNQTSDVFTISNISIINDGKELIADDEEEPAETTDPNPGPTSATTTAPATNNTNSTTKADNTDSPKTGYPTASVVVALALVSVAGIATFKKKA